MPRSKGRLRMRSFADLHPSGHVLVTIINTVGEALASVAVLKPQISIVRVSTDDQHMINMDHTRQIQVTVDRVRRNIRWVGWVGGCDQNCGHSRELQNDIHLRMTRVMMREKYRSIGPTREAVPASIQP